MITLSQREENELCRLLDMIPRLDSGSYPNALDKAVALDLYRKISKQRS